MFNRSGRCHAFWSPENETLFWCHLNHMHCTAVNRKVLILLTSHTAQTEFIRQVWNKKRPFVSHHYRRWIKSAVSKCWSRDLKVCRDWADLENFPCFDSAIKSCCKKFTSQKHIIGWWYGWQNLTEVNAVMQPSLPEELSSFPDRVQNLFLWEPHSGVTATAAPFGYQGEGNSLCDHLFLRCVYGIKSFEHFWLLLPRSWKGGELLPQRNRRIILDVCMLEVVHVQCLEDLLMRCHII